MKSYAVAAALALMAAMIVALSVQNRSLKSDVTTVQGEAQLPRVGAQLPRFEGVTLSGESVVIAESGAQPHVLFYFTTSCEYCIASMKYVREIANASKTLGMPFYGVTPQTDSEEVNKFMTEHNVEFDVVSIPDPRTLREFDFRMSPTLFIVSGSGQVFAQHVGEIRDNEDMGAFVTQMVPADFVPPTQLGKDPQVDSRAHVSPTKETGGT